MPTRWKSNYDAAIREQDPARLEEFCEKARHSINDRILELGSTPADKNQRQKLERALRELVAHQAKTQKPPDNSPTQ
jgi:hypothetical protein